MEEVQLSLYVVIPAYNEELNIERCVDDWYSVVEKHNDGGTSRLVIVNDGSKDQTYEKSGASGMQPRDPCRPWRGTLASGHKPR